MKRIDKEFQSYIGQGENSDLLVSVVEFDRRFDEFFEIDYLESEKKIQTDREEVYPGIEDSALSTSYLDYFQIYNDIKQGANLVDLGAGYCRGSLLFDRLGEKKCISVELEKNRLTAALKYCSDNIIHADLMDKSFDLPIEENYLIYLPTGPVLYELIKKVVKQKISANFYIIESHGDLVDYFFYLNSVFEYDSAPFKTSLPRHNPNIYKFKSKDFQPSSLDIYKDLPLWHLYNYDKELRLVIESTIPGSDKKMVWETDIEGSSIIKYNGELALWVENPSRVLMLNSQDKILEVISK